MALGAAKVIIILGASVAGSVLVQNGTASDFFKDTYKVLLKHLKNDRETGKQESVNPALLAQLTKLRQELNQISSDRSSVTIVTAGSGSKGMVVSVGIPAVLFGVVGYYYIRWRGWKLSDFMYVTRRNMKDAIESVSQKQQDLTTTLSATKRSLNSKMDKISETIDENSLIQEGLRNEVSLLNGDVAKYHMEIETVQKTVQALGMKINRLESKQEISGKGVIFLCDFVGGLEGSQRPPSIQGGNSLPRLERTSSTFWKKGGLKELQSISYALQSPESSASVQSSNETPKNSKPLQRNLSSTLSVGFNR